MICHHCGATTKETREGRYYKHKDPDGEPCDASGVFVPGSEPVVQDDDPFQAAPRGGRGSDAVPMSALGLEIAARFKELFYAFTSSEGRSAQTHLGPSEIGSPCDRRIVMSLLSRPAVNPGGDGWASFVGTWVHAGVGNMFVWGDRGRGRYASELPLKFPSDIVPKGTGDLLDRTLLVFEDFKVMGSWSLDKLRTEGPSPTYRVQVHTYAYGARKAGENVQHVAIVGLPREGSSLDNMYVWTEPYDPRVAVEALDRVEKLAYETTKQRLDGMPDLKIIERTAAEDDCKWCKYHAPGDDRFERGCPGR